jgi:hypothetical protein
MTEEPKIEDTSPDKQLKPARETRVTRHGVEVQNFEDIMRVASVAFRSRMLPTQIQTVEQAFMIVMTGADLGLKPSAAFKYLYLTKARRVALMTKGGLGVVYQSGYCEAYKEWLEGKGEEMRAVAYTKRKGMPDPFQREFSWEDAKEAGLLEQRQNRDGEDYDSTYQKYLKDMLLSRARGRVLEVAYPDVLGGTPMEGIAEDIDRGEAEARGQAPAAVEAGEPQKALPPPGPDPLLEALRGKKAEPDPETELVEVEAEVVQEKSAEQVEPPPEESEEDGELFG